MMRPAALLLMAAVAAFPLADSPATPVAWLAAAAFVVGAVGVAVWSVPVVTLAAVLALIVFALVRVITRPAADPIGALAFGATLVVLLALVHLAGRTHGAALGPGVVTAQVRQWLAVVAVGVGAGGALTVGAAVLRRGLAGATLPVVVAAAALGAVLTVAGVVALMTRDHPTA
jgi:hypothetical protein